MPLVNSLIDQLNNPKNYAAKQSFGSNMRSGPPKGPKEEIMNSQFTMIMPPAKASKKPLKNRRKPHNTSIVPKKQQ
jgi:hypothetical protein